MKKIILLTIGLLIALWLGGKLNELLFTPDVGVVVLSNESSEQIASVEISVCGQKLTFANVPAGEFVVARYDVTFDSHYDIKVTLQSGRMLDSETRYVTHGVDSIDVIVVTDGGIDHESSEISSKYPN